MYNTYSPLYIMEKNVQKMVFFARDYAKIPQNIADIICFL